MPRSSADATRFTATGPYVTTKPTSKGAPSSTSFASNPNTAPPYGAATSTDGTRLEFGASPPSNETPQQKIARLRTAAALAKRGKESGFDKTVRIGRIWADRAHRITALSLVGLTVVSAAVATAGITDMLLHNRRRRNEWLAEKKAQTARDVRIARQAQATGTATEDQILLINRERVAEEAALAKQNRPGMFRRATNWLYGGLSEEEKKGGRLGHVAAEISLPASSDGQEMQSAREALTVTMGTAGSQGEAGVRETRTGGGPLDRQAELAVQSLANITRSWDGWLR